ncbi:MAG: hypothetical protein JSV93_02715, partial [Candidatus Omnitrophota bacterium]
MDKRIIKIISGLLVQTFLFYNIGFAAIDKTPPSPEQKATIREISIDNIGIPKGIGSVKSKYRGEDGKLVIHIQDAHCNYEAQQNITKILEYLLKNYNINFVAVEGADGIVDTSWFKAFPDAEIRKEVADYFMEKGEITGAEFLSITSDYPFTIYGAESRKHYVKNLNSFLESYPYKDEFQKYYTGLKTVLNKLKRFIYTKELIDLDRKVIQHKEKEVKFADYAAYLKKIATSKKINIREYENFNTLIETLRYEKDIDFDIVNQERAALIDELSKELPKDKLSELVNKSIDFKVGKIEGNEFYTELAKLAKENNISLSKKYNNLARYIIYSRIYSRINNEKLFDEIDLLVAAIKERMFINADQRELNRLWTNVNVILGFMNIELTNKEYEYYLANKGQFTPDKFIDFISQNGMKFGLAYDLGEAPSELSYIFPKLVDFYEIATERDEIMIKNMFKGMRGKKTDVAVLITGGFHTKGIAKTLEDKDVSYVVISPAITKEAESPYISVLTGQKTPFEELLIEAEKSELQTASKMCGLCMDGHITDDSVSKAGKKFYTEVAACLIKSYIHLFPDTPKNNLKPLLVENFRSASKECPNRAGSRHILKTIRQQFDGIYDSFTESRSKTVGGVLSDDDIDKVIADRDTKKLIIFEDGEIPEYIEMQYSDYANLVWELIRVIEGLDKKVFQRILNSPLLTSGKNDSLKKAFTKENLLQILEPGSGFKIKLVQPKEVVPGVRVPGIVMTKTGSNFGHYSIKNKTNYIPWGMVDIGLEGGPLSKKKVLMDMMHELVEYVILKEAFSHIETTLELITKEQRESEEAKAHLILQLLEVEILGSSSKPSKESIIGPASALDDWLEGIKDEYFRAVEAKEALKLDSPLYGVRLQQEQMKKALRDPENEYFKGIVITCMGGMIAERLIGLLENAKGKYIPNNSRILRIDEEDFARKVKEARANKEIPIILIIREHVKKTMPRREISKGRPVGHGNLGYAMEGMLTLKELGIDINEGLWGIILAIGDGTRNYPATASLGIGSKTLLTCINGEPYIHQTLKQLPQYFDKETKGVLICSCDGIKAIARPIKMGRQGIQIVGHSKNWDDGTLSGLGCIKVAEDGQVEKLVEKPGKGMDRQDTLKIIEHIFGHETVPVNWAEYYLSPEAVDILLEELNVPSEHQDDQGNRIPLWKAYELDTAGQLFEGGTRPPEEWEKLRPDSWKVGDWIKMAEAARSIKEKVKFGFIYTGTNAIFADTGNNRTYYDMCQELFVNKELRQLLGVEIDDQMRIIDPRAEIDWEHVTVEPQTVILGRTKIKSGRIDHGAVVIDTVARKLYAAPRTLIQAVEEMSDERLVAEEGQLISDIHITDKDGTKRKIRIFSEIDFPAKGKFVFSNREVKEVFNEKIWPKENNTLRIKFLKSSDSKYSFKDLKDMLDKERTREFLNVTLKKSLKELFGEEEPFIPFKQLPSSKEIWYKRYADSVNIDRPDTLINAVLTGLDEDGYMPRGPYRKLLVSIVRSVIREHINSHRKTDIGEISPDDYALILKRLEKTILYAFRLSLNAISSDKACCLFYAPFIGILPELSEESITNSVMDHNEILIVIPTADNEIVKQIAGNTTLGAKDLGEIGRIVSESGGRITKNWRVIISVPEVVTGPRKPIFIGGYEIIKQEDVGTPREIKRLVEEEIEKLIEGLDEIETPFSISIFTKDELESPDMRRTYPRGRVVPNADGKPLSHRSIIEVARSNISLSKISLLEKLNTFIESEIPLDYKRADLRRRLREEKERGIEFDISRNCSMPIVRDGMKY